MTVDIDLVNHSKQPDTEKKIVQAASKVFMMKGKAGASMQDIADEAGINRTLLHYYFRSKDKLFDAIFNDLAEDIFPKVAGIFMQDLPLIKKFELFAESYVDLLKGKPFLPFFIFQEISLNPDRLLGLIAKGGLNVSVAMVQMKNELKKYGITKIDPRHLIASLLGMIIFPFIARPMFQKIAFNGDEDAYYNFLEERKKEVPAFIQLAFRGAADEDGGRMRKRRGKSEKAKGV